THTAPPRAPASRRSRCTCRGRPKTRCRRAPRPAATRGARAAAAQRRSRGAPQPLRLQLGGELRARDGLARDEQHGVLAGDRPGDVRVARDVDRLRERARVAVRRRHDDEVAARLGRERPPPQRVGELLARARVFRERVDEPAARMAHLDEAELVHVARDRRLHDLVTLAPQRVGELRLRRDRLGAHEALDRGVALVAVHAVSTSSRTASARSISSGETTSGGASLRTFAPDVSATRPPSSAASTKGCAGTSSSAPTSRPRPRTSTMCGSPASRARSCSPLARTRASSESSIVSHTASAAAHETGLPPNVEPWSPGANPPPTASATRSAPIGKPFASPFASVTRSGRTPSCSKAKNEPVRPRPVCTSSNARSAPSSRAAARNAGWSGITPPSPRTGSSSTTPTSSAIAPCSAATSFGGTKRTPPSSGSKAARFAGWPVAESEPSVRPWNPPSSAITPGLPVALRAYLSAASFASAPELQKNACAPPKRSDSTDASSRAGSVP